MKKAQLLNFMLSALTENVLDVEERQHIVCVPMCPYISSKDNPHNTLTFQDDDGDLITGTPCQLCTKQKRLNMLQKEIDKLFPY